MTLYYEEGLTQAEIARKIKISRPLVSKMLKEAKKTGLVEIYIKDENANAIALEIDIEKKYELQEVIVVPNKKSTTDAITKKNIGRACASYIGSILPQTKTIGISWGTTLAEFVDEMPYLQYPDIKIIPIMGGVGYSNVLYHSNHLAFLLAQKLSAKSTYLYTPALADSIRLKENLLESTMISTALTEGRNVDVAIVGIGNPIQSSTYKELGYFSNEDLIEFEQKGAIGDVVASFFNEHGEPVKTDISNRMMGINIDDLKVIPRTVVLATGKEKASSVKALLKKNIVNILVIDEEIAKNI